jgi:hypothetical protein
MAEMSGDFPRADGRVLEAVSTQVVLMAVADGIERLRVSNWEFIENSKWRRT